MSAPRYHAAVWDEPLVMELGAPGRRGVVFDEPEPDVDAPSATSMRSSRPGMRRAAPPDAARAVGARGAAPLPAPLAGDARDDRRQPLRHLHDEVQPARSRPRLVARPEIAELHPDQDDETLQGVLEIVHGLDLILRERLRAWTRSSSSRAAARTRRTRTPSSRAPTTPPAASSSSATRSSRRSRRTRATPATANAAGFKVVTLPLEENGYPSLDALKAAVSERTASLMVEQPRRHGRLQPRDRGVGRRRARCGRPLLLRPRELQRRHGAAARPASSASTPACTCSTRRSARPRAAAAPPSAPTAARPSWRRSCPSRSSSRDGDRYRLDSRPARLRRQGPRVLGQRAAARLRLRLESRAWAQTASSRPPTSRCSRTTTWRSGCSRSAASRSRSRTSPRRGSR